MAFVISFCMYKLSLALFDSSSSRCHGNDIVYGVPWLCISVSYALADMGDAKNLIS